MLVQVQRRVELSSNWAPVSSRLHPRLGCVSGASMPIPLARAHDIRDRAWTDQARSGLLSRSSTRHTNKTLFPTSTIGTRKESILRWSQPGANSDAVPCWCQRHDILTWWRFVWRVLLVVRLRYRHLGRSFPGTLTHVWKFDQGRIEMP
jgi:hypothetical protein